MLKFQGPILLEFYHVFVSIWEEMTQESILFDDLSGNLFVGSSSLGIITTCGHRYRPFFTEILVDLINMAHEEIIIRSPYIMLNGSLKNVIVHNEVIDNEEK